MTAIVHSILLATVVVASAPPASGQSARVMGTVRDETGAALPGVRVLLRGSSLPLQETETNRQGAYGFDGVRPGPAQLAFFLVNFGGSRSEIEVPSAGMVRVDAVLHLALSAQVTVTGKRTFTNLADAEDPARSLVGIAQSASQGAIIARQLETRPVMRAGEVLETVPGVVISQHSGEGKANQYLPPRLQSRSWDRLCDNAGGHARQHAHARPRSGVLGFELPDPRAGERSAVPRKDPTSPIWVTS